VISAVGDVMMGTAFPGPEYLPPNDGVALFEAVTKDLRQADIAFFNMEGTFADDGEPAKKCRDPKKCYVFRTPSHYVKNLTTAGFDFASLANNHCRDFGMPALKNTMAILDSVGIQFSGPKGTFARKTVGTTSVAMLAFAPYEGPLYNFLNLTDAKKRVAALKLVYDIVLVSFHGGAEGARFTHVPDSTEEFYGENRGNLREFAHEIIEAGADLVLGHGPHVPRAMEIYQNRLIAYSLGNFVTWGRFNLSGPNGLTYILQTELSPDGAFLSGKVIACHQKSPGHLTVDPEGRVISLLNSLAKSDFPETGVFIQADGTICPPATP
jgi:poly-gamma-glutamate capsule biosynthesis protein CapA/YwtB (metallophosphatase superfamily)